MNRPDKNQDLKQVNTERSASDTQCGMTVGKCDSMTQNKRSVSGKDACSLFGDFEDCVLDAPLDQSLTKNSEMSPEELKFLTYFLRRKEPKKVLEAGVSAGGTTRVALNSLLDFEGVEFSSVDIRTQWYHDHSKESGFLAREFIEARPNTVTWKPYIGYDLADCIDLIGGGIDFFILDTAHVLPGEFLSYIIALPYLEDGAVLVLHDVGLHTKRVLSKDVKEMQKMMYCNLLLFSAIMSSDKYLVPNSVPSNIGAIVIDKKKAMKHIDQVINMLFVPWRYIPSRELIDKHAEIIGRHYSSAEVKLFMSAYDYNKELNDQKKA